MKCSQGWLTTSFNRAQTWKNCWLRHRRWKKTKKCEISEEAKLGRRWWRSSVSFDFNSVGNTQGRIKGEQFTRRQNRSLFSLKVDKFLFPFFSCACKKLAKLMSIKYDSKSAKSVGGFQKWIVMSQLVKLRSEIKRDCLLPVVRVFLDWGDRNRKFARLSVCIEGSLSF